MARAWTPGATCGTPSGLRGASSATAHSSALRPMRVYRAPTASRLPCPCIGGPSLKTVFVTSASVGLPAGHSEKGAGGIWAVRMQEEGENEKGLAETRFRG